MNLLHELLQTLRVEWSPLLVSDTYLLEVEWCWMPHVGTELTPLGCYRTIGKLYQVEGIVDVALKLIYGYMGILVVIAILILARQTY